ncbi:MAG: MupA/Atu3671 family FMN-dependent luciferase-like monooxygenase, partial [Chloroflexota bacterium]
MIVVTDVAVLTSASGAPAGTVVSVNDDAIHVSTAHGDVALRTLLTIDGQPLPVSDLVRRFGVHAGYRFPMLSQEMSARLTAINARLARHERFWVERLATLTTIELPYANRSASGAGSATPHYDQAPMSIAADLLAALRSSDEAASPADLLAAAVAAYLGRLGGTQTFDLGFSDMALQRDLAGLEGIFATRVPLRVALDASTPASESLRAILDELAVVRKRASYVRDTVARFPSLQPLVARGGQPSFAVSLEIGDDLADWAPAPGTELTVRVAADGHAMCWYHDPAVFSAADIAAMQRQFVEFLHGAAAGDTPLAEVSLLSSDERSQMLVEWNATRVSYPEDACIHRLFEAQVDRTPDAVAVAFEDRQITYRELDARANQLARHLQGLGVGPETMVGIFMERSIELIVALYGVHKAGGAYVPLDPTYPADRLSFMVEDSGLAVLLTQRRLLNQLPAHDASVVQVDADWGTIARQGAERPVSLVTSENLAYVIYTSGSTGKPKGVMVKHQNAVNFFVGMDERLNRDPGSVWLAVTSLSFDISVLELFWTLTRGFKVVLQSDSAKPASSPRALRPATDKEIAFSLSYFASDEGEGVADKYQLLMEGAKFADRHGFSAVWTPERHFHAFGGLYPNPSVASAAIAAVTERVQIRAGSVVMPLHSPIRVAEEWSLVDNLSKGRVGISFAAGWQPNDFAIAPERFAARKDVMLRDLATVRKLWRGETVAFPGPTGEDVQVTTLPRPVQAELPVWLTAAGSPETFRIAGEIGAGLLTHLLGQSLEDLTVKLAIYRQAWQAAGHPGTGHATLMLHTFVGDDEETVRETVRGPMKEYLRSSVDLIRKAAWSFPAFAKSLDAGGQTPGEIFDSGVLSDEEMEALLDHAFERYFKSSGLFGTPQSCLEIVDRLKAMDIDEIACLIDFGVPSSVALEHLEQLKTLMDLSRPGADRAADYSIPAQIERHTVTHLQCTPSMAGMLLMDERTRASLRPLKNMMVGGEAFPVPLARQLAELVAGDVINMYGPTETTIWSSTHAVDEIGSIIPIGRPIANTELYVLDRQLQPVPVGVAGELFIGGDGVVRGYLNRPELTADRFIADQFSGRPDARLYRTGDLARFRPDGNIELLGRA